MADLTPIDHVALDLCPQYVDCPSCRQRAGATSRMLDERLAASRRQIHELMRGWSRIAGMTPFSPQQQQSAQNLGHVVEELRKVVGHEGEA